ncbi:MAG TPA: DUF6152 family protein, partial [Gammaproteobacteria bacterium]|nr:DUF6152 family protein [Gammaproteobacteria bacterium]
WRNPHVYFELEVRDSDGKANVQQIEAGPASSFVAMGFNADAIRKGDRLKVQAKPNRAGPGRVVLGWQLTKVDGTVIPLHVRAVTTSVAPTAEATGLAGVWLPQATGFSSLAVAARDWPLTDKARALAAATRDARAAQRAACVPYGPPALMAVPSAATVEVGTSEVTFTIDAMNVRRVVHLDQPSHPVPLEPTVLGHSIGHWEGGTLVVDTAGFTAHPEGYAFDLPSSAAKHVVERFSLSADRKHLEYEATVDDSEYFTAPVKHRSQWDYRPELKPSNLPCDPEAASRFTTDE